MPKYLVTANYTQSGMKGVLAEGGSARRDALEKMIANAGGTLESFHFAFGEHDAYLIIDGPDNVTAAGMSMLVNASGAATSSVTVLLTPEEIDRAARTDFPYRAPGE